MYICQIEVRLNDKRPVGLNDLRTMSIYEGCRRIGKSTTCITVAYEVVKV